MKEDWPPEIVTVIPWSSFYFFSHNLREQLLGYALFVYRLPNMRRSRYREECSPSAGRRGRSLCGMVVRRGKEDAKQDKGHNFIYGII